MLHFRNLFGSPGGAAADRRLPPSSSHSSGEGRRERRSSRSAASASASASSAAAPPPSTSAPAPAPAASGPTPPLSLPKFLRNTGSLGLSKSELDRRCRPSGLYPTCQWDDRAVRRLVGDGRLAARLRGSDARCRPGDRECPICFLHYSQINVTGCCGAAVCTECYLQIRPRRQKEGQCPFCNNPRLSVSVARDMAGTEVARREEEEQRVIEARIRARGSSSVAAAASASVASSLAEDDAVGGGGVGGPRTPPGTPDSGFGSSLERQVRRAHSGSSDGGASEAPSGSSDLSELALTPEERRALEEEMRGQTSHSSWRQVEEEAERRRAMNERDYFRTHSGRLLSRALGGGLGGASGAAGRDSDSVGSSHRHQRGISSNKAKAFSASASASAASNLTFGGVHINELTLPELQTRKRELKRQLEQYDMNFARQHGRMPVKAEKEPIRHLYESYNALKSRIALLEREGVQPVNQPSGAPVPYRRSPSANSSNASTASTASDNSSASGDESPTDAAPHKTKRKEKASGRYGGGDTSSSPPPGSGTPSGAPLRDLAALRAEKQQLHQMLRSYEKDFFRLHNRQVSSYADIRPVASQYRRYKEIKKAIAALQQGGG